MVAAVRVLVCVVIIIFRNLVKVEMSVLIMYVFVVCGSIKMFIIIVMRIMNVVR